jgi:hypothetical protein
MIVTLAVLWAVGRSSAGERVIPTVQTMPQWDQMRVPSLREIGAEIVTVFYGMELTDLEQNGQGKGMLEDINVLQLKDIELIDWGDAGWGDPALDLCGMDLRAIPLAIKGYREVQAFECDDTLEARVLWDQR